MGRASLTRYRILDTGATGGRVFEPAATISNTKRFQLIAGNHFSLLVPSMGAQINSIFSDARY